MKRIVWFVLAFICIADAAYAEGTKQNEPTVRTTSPVMTTTTTVCLDGLQFAVAGMKEAGVSIVQVYIEKDGKVVPRTCR